MAGLGAGAGAAERMMIDDKMAEQAAQAAANRQLRREEMAEGARRFDAQRADAQARQQAAETRQAKLDAEASAQTARNNARQDRLDQINLGQLNRQNERQDRMDAAAMEDAAWKRDRAERLDAQSQERQDWTDAWTSVFNQQRLEQQQAAFDRQNALDQEIFDNINREREARAMRQQGLDETKERLVNFAINAPQEYRDPASQYAYIQAMNAQLTQLTGKDHGLTRMSFDPQSGGIAFWGVQRDGNGNVVMGKNGPAERLLDFISRDNVDAIAEKRGLQYDPYQQAFVQKGSTAYTGGGRAAASGRGASSQSGSTRGANLGDVTKLIDMLKDPAAVEALGADRVAGYLKAADAALGYDPNVVNEPTIRYQDDLLDAGWKEADLKDLRTSIAVMSDPNADNQLRTAAGKVFEKYVKVIGPQKAKKLGLDKFITVQEPAASAPKEAKAKGAEPKRASFIENGR